MYFNPPLKRPLKFQSTTQICIDHFWPLFCFIDRGRLNHPTLYSDGIPERIFQNRWFWGQKTKKRSMQKYPECKELYNFSLEGKYGGQAFR